MHAELVVSGTTNPLSQPGCCICHGQMPSVCNCVSSGFEPPGGVCYAMGYVPWYMAKGFKPI